MDEESIGLAHGIVHRYLRAYKVTQHPDVKSTVSKPERRVGDEVHQRLKKALQQRKAIENSYERERQINQSNILPTKIADRK